MIDLCGQGFQVTGLSISKKKKKKRTLLEVIREFAFCNVFM